MVSTGDPQLHDLVRMLTKHGGKDKYNVDHIGYNARLDTLQAAILLVKLKHIDDFNARRRAIALRYNEGLKDVPGVTTPEIIDGHVVHQYTVRVGNRDQVQADLKTAGVQSMVYYPFPLHTMKVFKDNGARIFGSLANAEKASLEVMSLPIEPLQTREATEAVIAVLSKSV